MSREALEELIGRVADCLLGPRVCAGCGEPTFNFYSKDLHGEYCEGCTEDAEAAEAMEDPAGGDEFSDFGLETE